MEKTIMNPAASAPTDVSIITTYRCCMRCKMCNIWKHPSDILKEVKAKELEILPQLKFINITGGEPFVRNDLEDIVEVAFTKAPRVVISTAGYHVDEILALADRFPHIGIRVSLEGLSTVNDCLRGRRGGFDRGIRTLMGLRQMGVKDIGIATTVSHMNCRELVPLYKLTTELNMDFATAAFHNSFYFHKQDNFVQDQNDVSACFFDLADHLLKEKHPKNWFRAFFNVGLINYINGNKRLLPCEAGTVNFFIEPYGEVYPCNGLEARFWKESMGNIRDFRSFDQLWHGSQAKKVRTLVETCPKNCWMVGTAAPVMKKYLRHPLKWVLKHKIKSLLGKKIDRNCLPAQFDVGQSPLQGDLRGGALFSTHPEFEMPSTDTLRIITEVVENRKLTSDAFLLKLKKGSVSFTPGQYVSIGPYLEHYKSRDYTLCSSNEDHTLDFLIKKVKHGRISPYLASLSPGEKVEMVGPYGGFCIVDPPGIHHVFIATGVGIGPFLSFIKTYPDLDYTLIHGIRNKEDMILAAGVDKNRYKPCITQEGGSEGNLWFKGRVTRYITTIDLPDGAVFYLCGNPYMLKQMQLILSQNGTPEEKILTEPYYAY